MSEQHIFTMQKNRWNVCVSLIVTYDVFKSRIIIWSHTINKLPTCSNFNNMTYTMRSKKSTQECYFSGGGERTPGGGAGGGGP